MDKQGNQYSLAEAERIAEDEGHFDKVPAPVLRAFAKQQSRRDGWWLSPSSAAYCPRQRLLEITEDYFLSVKTLWAAFSGSAKHKLIDAGGRYDEMHLSTDLLIPWPDDPDAYFITFPLRGTLDAYNPRTQTLQDWKTTSKKELSLNPAHALQLNLYRLLLEENGYLVKRLQVWYAGNDPWFPRELFDVPMPPLDEVYLRAVELATPLALARETGKLPECVGGKHYEPLLCRKEIEWNSKGVPSGI